MFKDVVAPIQAWLLSQGRCVGCGKELKDGKMSKLKDGTEKIACSCGRILFMILNPKSSEELFLRKFSFQ